MNLAMNRIENVYCIRCQKNGVAANKSTKLAVTSGQKQKAYFRFLIYDPFGILNDRMNRSHVLIE